MNREPLPVKTLHRRLWLGLALLVLIAGLLLGYKALHGRLSTLISLIKGTAQSASVRQLSTGAYTNIIFLHHSVGNNLIEQGDVRGLFTRAGYEFWDQGYNNQGLRQPDGSQAGFVYTVPNDNTDLEGLSVIFQQPVSDLPLNTLSGLLQHEVILIKSCYPNNNIASDAQLDQAKTIYLQMAATMERYPEKIFILLTTPPLNPAETNLENSRRANQLADWLASDAFNQKQANVFVFDFYHLLAENNAVNPEAGMLRLEYRNGTDSHPNEQANRKIGPLLVDFVISSIGQFRSN